MTVVVVVVVVDDDDVAEVPDLLPDAGGGAEDRAADGSVRAALLSVQPSDAAAVAEPRHGLCPLVRRHHAQHRPPHTQHQR